MARNLTISDDLAERLESRRLADGLPTLDAAAESVLRAGLREEETEPYSIVQLRALIDEAELSGPAKQWDAAAVRAEILRRYAARKAG